MKHFASTVLSGLFSLQLFLNVLPSARAADVTITGQVAARPVASFQVSAPPSAVAGEPFSVTITALDADGFPTTNVAIDLTVSTTNGGTITPITISASQFTDDGVWTGNMTLTRAGTGRTINVASGSATGGTTMTVTAGPLDHVVVTPDTATVAAGGTTSFSAQGFDQFENVISGLTFVWTVIAGGGTIDQNGTFTAGDTPGTYSNTVRASATDGSTTRSDTSSVTVTGGGGFFTEIIETIREIRETLRQNPIAQTITQTITPVFAPVATTVATITAISQILTAAPVLVSIGDVFLYTSYLWSVLLEFLGFKRRRKPWGVVYNAETKEPIPLVVVQLIDEETAQPIEQRVTDPYGRFGFLVHPGRYRIQPTHPNYAFPSKISPDKGDLRYTDLYHGEEIMIEDPNTVLAVNVPLDPLAAEVATRSSRFPRVSFRKISLALLIVSVLLQGFSVFLEPNTRNFILFSIYLTVLIAIALLLARRKRTWGVVYDAQTKRELANAQIFVTQEEDPRFASRKVTDEFGRFYMLLPKGTYRLSVQYPEYTFPAPAESIGYKGEPLAITPQQPLIHVDIPVAPNQRPDEEQGEEPAGPQFVRLT